MNGDYNWLFVVGLSSAFLCLLGLIFLDDKTPEKYLLKTERVSETIKRSLFQNLKLIKFSFHLVVLFIVVINCNFVFLFFFYFFFIFYFYLLFYFILFYFFYFFLFFFLDGVASGAISQFFFLYLKSLKATTLLMGLTIGKKKKIIIKNNKKNKN